MENNNGKGLYEVGERHILACGCVVVAEIIGYTHYVDSHCKLDNKFHPSIKGYTYKLA